MATIKTVKMIKPGNVPPTADVHPDEVENMKKTGWQEAPEKGAKVNLEEEQMEGKPGEGVCLGGLEYPENATAIYTKDSLMEKSVKELRALASDLGVTLSREDNRKDEIAARILEHPGNFDNAASA
jgi:hypothetical protein